MKKLAVLATLAVGVAFLAYALPARASHPVLRVERLSKGAGARATSVRLVSGLVTHRMRARVLTDTRCAPDAMGVSHCLNRMQLADGTSITVVHDHRMMDMPCLSPGERVVLTPR